MAVPSAEQGTERLVEAQEEGAKEDGGDEDPEYVEPQGGSVRGYERLAEEDQAGAGEDEAVRGLGEPGARAVLGRRFSGSRPGGGCARRLIDVS